MLKFAHDIAGGQGNLIVTSLKSPNFVHGVSGWAIGRDGSAEFHDIIIPAGSGGTVVTFAGSAPADPNDGDVWYDTANDLEASVWNGTEWVPYQLGTNAIADGAISTELIASEAITNALLAANAVATANIQNLAVGTAQIAANAITAAKIAANTITAGQIAANTITAAQLAAGIVYAGIVNSTTVNAATFTGSVFEGTDFIINSAGAFFYSGTPASGNLIASIAAAGGTDGFSNAYLGGISVYSGGLTVQLNDGTAQFYPFSGTPHTPGEIFAGGTGVLTANSPTESGTDSGSQLNLYSKTAAAAATLTGALQVTDGTDGQVYNTQIRTLATTADSATLVSLTTILSTPVGIRKYRVHAQLFISATSGAEFDLNFSMPTGSGGKVSFVICRATTFVAQVTGAPNTSFGAAVALATDAYSVVIDGLVTVTTAGTMALQVGSLTSTGLVVQQSSSIDIIPV